MKENINDIKKNAKDLEDILLGMETGVNNISNTDILPKLRSISPMNYDKVKNESDEKSTKIVESVILMYLPSEFVEQHDYIFQKMEVDKLTISNLLFQMTTAEHAIKKLLEEIDNGSTGARSFEVLSSLQRSKMEIVKHLQSFMVTMENNYKNLKYDYLSNNVEKKIELPTYEIKQLEESKEENNTTKFRGTKALMSMVKQQMEETDDEKKQEETHDDVKIKNI